MTDGFHNFKNPESEMRKWLLFIAVLSWQNSIAQRTIPLYEGQIPNSKASTNKEEQRPNPDVDTLTLHVSVPTLSVFLPPPGKANGTAVIICPGGGYGMLLTKREGSDVARAFNTLGITAFVLKYRIPSDETMADRSIGPLQDAQQAIKIVRERAAEWEIDPQKIGIMGFSAGGHLASSAGTHFQKSYLSEKHSVNLRPDFMLLINPVISFSESIGHLGSRDNLLGRNAAKEGIKLFSNELQIDKSTPPTFLIHAGTDVVVPVANSLEFYKNLKDNGVSGELHIYSSGEHGFLTYPTFNEWFERCVSWMGRMKLMN